MSFNDVPVPVNPARSISLVTPQSQVPSRPSPEALAVCYAQALALFPKKHQPSNLFMALWRSSDSFHQIGKLDRPTKLFKNIPVTSVSEALEQATALSAAGIDAYLACAEYLTPDNRTAANVSGAYAFWMDIDCGQDKAAKGKGYQTEEEARQALAKFCSDTGLPSPTHIVSSGGGLHVYWVLDSLVPRESWQGIAKQLKSLTKILDFLADDTRTADIASVLRIPDTLNYKYDPPRPVILREASDQYISKELMLGAIDSAYKTICKTEDPKTPCPQERDNCSFVVAKHTPSIDLSISQNNRVARVEMLLAVLDPDMGYAGWLKVLMSVFCEFEGSAVGFDLANDWSSRGHKYAGEKDIQAKWKSFKSDSENPITIGTLIKMAKDTGGDVSAILAATDEPFEVYDEDTIVIVEGQSAEIPIATPNPLDQYSLRGMSAELEKGAVDDVPVLGGLALQGQATVFYAAPNTGKTLITCYLLVEAIKSSRIYPSKVYYLNMDDTEQGLIAKLRIAEEFDFHMLAEGHRDFSARNFLAIVRHMIDNDQARGVVIILDTLKKFVDLMDKGKASTFTSVIRPFVMKGGTVIALAHTNKHPGKDGKPIYGGVSDIMNDVDCAYTIGLVSEADGQKVVEFTNTKRRGNVMQNAAYSYSVGNVDSYNELVLSVQTVDPESLQPIKQSEALKSDSEVIQAIAGCIRDGVLTKMKLADAAAKRAGISRRSALQVIEKYTGNDPVIHQWSFAVGERGAKVYALLESTENLTA